MRQLIYKSIIMLGLIIGHLSTFSQNNFIDVKNLLNFSQPIYDMEGNLIIMVTLKTTNDTTKYTSSDFEFKQLLGTVSLHDKTINMRPIDPTGVGLSRRYIINREATGLDKNLKASGYSIINYKLLFSLRGADSSKNDEFKNIVDDKVNSRLIVGAAVRRAGEKYFTVKVKAIHDGVRIIPAGTFVKRNKEDRSLIADLQKDVILTSKDSYSDVILNLADGNEIHQGDFLYLNLHATKDLDEYNLYEDPRFTIRLSVPYEVEKLSNSVVTGNKEGKIVVSTSIPGENLTLNFKINPLSIGNLGSISGVPEPGTNNFSFKIPSNSHEFKTGKHELVFSGESKDEQAVTNRSGQIFYFEKKSNQCNNISISQNKGDISISATLDEGNQDVYLAFLNEKGQQLSSVSMEKTNEKTVSKKFSCNDVLLTGMVDTVKRKITIGVSIEGALSCVTNFDDISILYKRKAEDDLKKLASSFHKEKNKKKAIQEYLDKTGFVGNTSDLAENIVLEAAKEPSKQDWSGIWQTAAKLLPVAIKGLFLLL